MGPDVHRASHVRPEEGPREARGRPEGGPREDCARVLAMNIAVEANRAGEAGAGFAVIEDLQTIAMGFLTG
jgi:hypothetical protein